MRTASFGRSQRKLIIADVNMRGSYYLSVEDVQHHVLDRILFTVR
jgi:hypothetical protein